MKDLPPRFDTEVQKEQAWLSLIFKKLQEQRQPDWVHRQKVRGLLENSRPEPSCLERVTSLEGPQVAIKREREESVERKTLKAARAWSIELKASKSVMDLDPDDDAAPNKESLEQALEGVMEEECPDVFEFGAME